MGDGWIFYPNLTMFTPILLGKHPLFLHSRWGSKALWVGGWVKVWVN